MTTLHKHKRNKKFIDRKVQGSLALRIVAYWFSCLISVCFILAFWTAISTSVNTNGDIFARIWEAIRPALLGSLMFLPIVVYDAIRYSHRFAGPVMRIRQTVSRLADGANVPPIVLRKGDFWTDVADEVNRLNERVRQLESTLLKKELTMAKTAKLDQPSDGTITVPEAPISTSI